jgi:hypothetical protein
MDRNRTNIGFVLVTIGAFFFLFTPFSTAEGKSPILLNGSLNSSMDLKNDRLFPSGDGGLSWGWSNLTNLRLKASPNGNLSFYLAVNIQYLTGNYAAQDPGNIFSSELERLYFKAGTDLLDVEIGLIRIPFGYGYIFSPLDLFNVRDTMNSLDPQARPKGKWGLHATFYPQDMWKIELFGLAPEDPLQQAFWGGTIGAATNFNADKTNWEFLYALTLPEIAGGLDPSPPFLYKNNDYTQIAGFALKADIEIGLHLEALYRFDHRALKENNYYGKEYAWYNGLEAALGIDYSFPDINLYFLAEYLFYGSGHVDWNENNLDSLFISNDWDEKALADRYALINRAKKPLSFARHDYLYLMLRLTPTDGLTLGVSCLAGLDDVSALCSAFLEYEVFQGFTVEAAYSLPLDKRLFEASAEAGEWSSTVLGFYHYLRLCARVKF